MNKWDAFMLGDKNTLRDSYIWNTLGGLMNAGQSVLFLIIITRVCGVVDAGIFSIAFATANLFLTIGNYGVRSFQATDIKKKYSFGTYLSTRLYTVIAMILVSIGYVLFNVFTNGYSTEKAVVILLMCLLKTVDAYEDVFVGMYQQNNRLDIGAKSHFIRLGSTIFLLCLLILISRNLVFSFLVGTIFSVAVAVYLSTTITPHVEKMPSLVSFTKTIPLLRACFGLFFSTFLSFYILNAPKYAIDRLMSEEMQAYYGFIAMPVFVVGLLAGFLYQPILISLAKDWNDGHNKAFISRIIKQHVIIIALTALTVAGAYFLGVPVLSMLYHTDLSSLKNELLILLVGGGLLAISGFLTICITIIRRQKDLIWGYLFVAVLSGVLSPKFVADKGLTGAAWIYTIMVGLLCVIFEVVLFARIYGKTKNS